MRTPIVLTFAFALSPMLGLGSLAHAVQTADPAKISAAELRAARDARIARLRAFAGIFRKIAVEQDWKGSHVVYRDKDVTGFVDLTDPAHPHFDPARPDEDESLAKIPMAQRAHILVVPNIPREHIAQSLDAQITLPDLEAATRVLQAAHQLALDLKIVDPRVYINQTEQIGVGYLHAHIVGKTSMPYPRILQP